MPTVKPAIDFRSLLAGGAGALALAISTAPPSLAQTVGPAAANAFDEDYVTRVNSSVPDISANPRLLFGNRGGPQTLHVAYSDGF
jgi:hypothetical protein